MDGKSKKILNFMKKSGTELEADEIAFPLKMDEDLVKKLLNELKQENLVTERTDEKGRSFFTAAAEQPKADKRAKAKDDDDEDFEPKKAPRIITEDQVLDIDDFSPKAAPPPIAPVPQPVASPPPIQTYEEHMEEFSPRAEAQPVFAAAPAPAAPPKVSMGEFTTETSSVARDELDLDDFSPKAEKKKKVKEPKIKEPKVKEPKIADDGDFEAAEKSSSPAAKYAIPGVVVLLLLIVAFFLGASSGAGKVKSAVDKASVDFVKTADFGPVKDNADKVSGMEGEISNLKDKLADLEKKVEALQARPAAAARPAANRAPARGGRR